jgi:hypothetical protein
MIAPETALRYLLSALTIGAALGAVYDFLRPLRPRLTAVSDGIFVLAALWGWIYLTFGICGSDSRIGCTLALPVGGIVWEMTLGRLFRPVFSYFWRVILWPGRKIFIIFQKFYKFLLAFGKKWFTMVGTMIRLGGAHHGKDQSPQAGAAQKQSHHKSRHSGRRRFIRGGTGGTVRLHRQNGKSI